jgi:hypothetical protein
MIIVDLAHHLSTVRINMPSSWDECTFADLLAIISSDDSDISRQNLTLSLIKNRLKPKEYKVLENLNAETFYENYKILTDFLNNTCTLTQFPQDVLINTALHAPANDFNCITVGEFEICSEHFNNYLAKEYNNDDEQFVELCEMFFYFLRPASSTGKRIPIDAITVVDKKEVTKNIQALSAQALAIILLWFVGCANKLPTYFPLSYSTTNAGNAQPDPMAITKLIHAAAADKEATARTTIRQMLLKEFMYDLELKLQKTDS